MQEGAQDGRTLADSPTMIPGGIRQLVDIDRSEVGKRVPFQITPKGFNGVEFGRVSRKEFDMNAPVFTGVIFDQDRPVNLRTVPNDKKRPLKMTAKVFKKRDDGPSGDIRVGVDGKIKSHPSPDRRNRKRRNHGDFLVGAPPLIQERCLADRSPCAADKRSHENPALVDKDDMRFQFLSFFLTSGHRTLTQRRIPFSSRSIARRSGLWGLKPKECRSLEI